MSKRAARSRKEIPSFANEDQERRFWAKEDTADYFDWDKAVQPTLPALKPMKSLWPTRGMFRTDP